jgi:RHH-type rel operon transcriptional repressor/antitoxin RelB
LAGEVAEGQQGQGAGEGEMTAGRSRPVEKRSDMRKHLSRTETAMLALRLPPELEKRLDALAKKTGRTKSFYAREAIMRHIEDIEDQQLASSRAKRGDGRKSLKALERRKGVSDADWLRSLSAGLREWSSPADAKAYDDL